MSSKTDRFLTQTAQFLQCRGALPPQACDFPLRNLKKRVKIKMPHSPACDEYLRQTVEVLSKAFLGLSNLFGGTKEAHHVFRVKSRGRSTQRTFRYPSFLSPFCGWNPKQSDGANPFIQALFWRPTPLKEQMIVVSSFSAFTLGLRHTRSS